MSRRKIIATSLIIILAAIAIAIAVILLTMKPVEDSHDSLLPRSAELNLEYVMTADKQARGLSGRDGLAENSGMLFVYQNDARPGFWMKEMLFPLDIVWLDAEMRIVGIERDISPDTYPQIFMPPQPIRYVLEINAGKSAKLGWEIGDKVL